MSGMLSLTLLSKGAIEERVVFFPAPPQPIPILLSLHDKLALGRGENLFPPKPNCHVWGQEADVWVPDPKALRAVSGPQARGFLSLSCVVAAVSWKSPAAAPISLAAFAGQWMSQEGKWFPWPSLMCLLPPFLAEFIT